eukprot:290284-Karenia_brevis.AAC.1
MSASDRAHLRSHAGRFAAAVMVGAPTSKDFEVEPADFRTLLLERMRLPLPLTDAVCEGCGAAIDERAMHRAACSESGRLKARAGPMERTMARICREAGATVRMN